MSQPLSGLPDPSRKRSEGVLSRRIVEFYRLMRRRTGGFYRFLCQRSGYFGPNWIEAFVIFLLAMLTGLTVYAQTVRDTYVHLYDEYRKANVSGAVLAPDPAVPPLSGNAVSVAEDSSRLFRSLQLLKLVPDEETPDGLKRNKSSALIVEQAMNYPSNPSTEIRPENKGNEEPDRQRGAVSYSRTPTVDLIVHLVFHLGAESGQSQNADYQAKLADLVAAVLANQPGAATEFRNGLAKFNSRQDTQPPGEVMKAFGPQLPWKKGFVFKPDDPPPITNVELIAGLYQLAGVDRAFNPRDPSAKFNKPDDQSRLRVMTKFLEALIDRLRADTHVKKATKDVPLFQGYEQSVMWVIFCWMLYLLTWREWRRRRAWEACRSVLGYLARVNEWAAQRPEAERGNVPAETAAQIMRRWNKIPLSTHDRRFRPIELAARIALTAANYVLMNRTGGASAEGFREFCKETRQRESGSRWFIRYLTFALPAVGFIGTKRGIAGALSQADSIVRAQDPGSQAAAITMVTSVLGIAFTTTLIALLMGLLLNLINSAQMHQESAIIDDVQEALSPLLEPERHFLAQRPEERAGDRAAVAPSHDPSS